MVSDPFDALFLAATGYPPYDYQRRRASKSLQCRLIHIPTGAGKTAAAIIAWLWRLKMDRDNTPRRLIYCLPMRASLEQTPDWDRRPVEDVRRGGGLVKQIDSSARRNRRDRRFTQRRTAVWAT